MKRALAMLALSCGPREYEQRPQVCRDYVQCYERINDTAGTASKYQVAGLCWSTTADAEAACRMECADGNATFLANGMAADAGCTIH